MDSQSKCFRTCLIKSLAEAHHICTEKALFPHKNSLRTLLYSRHSGVHYKSSEEQSSRRREQKRTLSRGSVTGLTHRSGNWDDADRPDRLLQRNEAADICRKSGRPQCLRKSEGSGDCDSVVRTGSSRIGKAGGDPLPREIAPSLFLYSFVDSRQLCETTSSDLEST